MSTVRIWQTVSTSSLDTERLGQLLAQNLRGGEVLELVSDLGGGKTTFVRGLAKGLQSSAAVSSPTFTIEQIYIAGELTLHHYDFYRLASDPGVVAMQLAEALDDPKSITVVEWAEAVKDVLPEQRIAIEFERTATSPDERKISITYPEKDTEIIQKLENEWSRE